MAYVGAPGDQPLTIAPITQILKTDKSPVPGSAQIGICPGDAPVADGKVDGDTIAFTATGHRPSSGGIPTHRVVATIHGDETDLKLSMIAFNGPNSWLDVG